MMTENQTQTTQSLQFNEKEHKYLITLYKGQSAADPERFENNKLIMLRLGITVVGRLTDLTDRIPPELQYVADIVKTTDIDLEIIVKFLEKKMDHNAVVKFFATLVDVYKVAKVGDKIGELEMDEEMFKEFLKMLHYMFFKTIQNDAVF